MTLTSLGEFLFMDVKPVFNPQDFIAKKVSKERSLPGMYKKNHPSVKVNLPFHRPHSPIRG
jgi:hypothetical protein